MKSVNKHNKHKTNLWQVVSMYCLCFALSSKHCCATLFSANLLFRARVELARESPFCRTNIFATCDLSHKCYYSLPAFLLSTFRFWAMEIFRALTKKAPACWLLKRESGRTDCRQLRADFAICKRSACWQFCVSCLSVLLSLCHRVALRGVAPKKLQRTTTDKPSKNLVHV